MIRRLASGLFLCLILAQSGAADMIRVATLNTDLSRKGPGLLLRDIEKGDEQFGQVVRMIAAVRPDIILLQDIDWDLDGKALEALQDRLQDAGASYPYHFAPRPNRGLATDLDLNGDGRRGDPEDAQGFGYFTGDGAMALLSRWPVNAGSVVDHSAFLWRDLPGALLPMDANGLPFPSAEAQAVQRLSTTGHWRVPIQLPDGDQVTILAYHATPPVFDGPEDRNGRRNHDETRFWSMVLDGALGDRPEPPFVLVGDANLDPDRGDGRRAAIQSLLDHPALQDPKPTADGTGTATVDWTEIGLGHMRVSYVLPSIDLSVAASGVYWPEQNPDTIRHGLVWVDLVFP